MYLHSLLLLLLLLICVNTFQQHQQPFTWRKDLKRHIYTLYQLYKPTTEKSITKVVRSILVVYKHTICNSELQNVLSHPNFKDWNTNCWIYKFSESLLWLFWTLNSRLSDEFTNIHLSQEAPINFTEFGTYQYYFHSVSLVAFSKTYFTCCFIRKVVLNRLTTIHVLTSYSRITSLTIYFSIFSFISFICNSYII